VDDGEGPSGQRPEGGAVSCPATMCPLVAPKGSPWTGSFRAPCPESDACPWWGMACSTGGVQAQVEEAAASGGAVLVAGPDRPRRGPAAPRGYDCPVASECSWQRQAGEGRLCPPRDALSRGLDPRVCLF